MLSTSPNPKRKYPQTLEMVKAGDTWVGVNTMLTNKVLGRPQLSNEGFLL